MLRQILSINQQYAKAGLLRILGGRQVVKWSVKQPGWVLDNLLTGWFFMIGPETVY